MKAVLFREHNLPLKNVCMNERNEKKEYILVTKVSSAGKLKCRNSVSTVIPPASCALSQSLCKRLKTRCLEMNEWNTY